MQKLIFSALLAMFSLMGGQVALGEEPVDRDTEERERDQCKQIQRYAYELYDDLDDFEKRVRKYEYRSQLQFALGNAKRSVGTLYYQAERTDCDRHVMKNALEGVRDRLDVVRHLFRDNHYLSAKPDLFEAFRDMVESWENLRDSITIRL